MTFSDTLKQILSYMPDGMEISFDSTYKTATLKKDGRNWIVWLGFKNPTMIKTSRLNYAIKRIQDYLKIADKINET